MFYRLLTNSKQTERIKGTVHKGKTFLGNIRKEMMHYKILISFPTPPLLVDHNGLHYWMASLNTNASDPDKHGFLSVFLALKK